MYQEFKEELIIELGIKPEDRLNFNMEYSIAWRKANEDFTSPVDVFKQAIKSILIAKLEANAKATHKTFFGKVGAFLSLVGAKILPFVNFNKKK